MSSQNPQTSEEILKEIENQIQYLLGQKWIAIEIFVNGKVTEKTLKKSSKKQHLRAKDFERFCDEWASIVPDSVYIKAELAHLFAERYGLVVDDTPKIAVTLGLHDPDVQAVYQKLYNQPIESILKSTARDDKRQSELSMFLLETQLAALQDYVFPRFLQRDEVLFEEGDPGDRLYVITSGRVEVIIGKGEQAKVVRELGQHELFGELSLLTDSPRSATIRALRDTELWYVSKDMFKSMAEQHPRITLQILQMIGTRFGQSEYKGQVITHSDETRHFNKSLNFAVIFLDEVRLDFADTLAEHLASYGTVQVINAERFDSHFGQEDAAQTDLDSPFHMQLAKHLIDMELQHEYLFLVADPEPSNWTGRCLLQADRILFVADSQTSPQVRENERYIYAHYPHIRKELILLHPSATDMPSDTARWLDNRELHTYHHVRQGDESHLRRLTRRLTGNAVGLVLSGGGAHGLSHIGVLCAIEEEDIEIDMIGGTSMGAIIAAGVALGRTSAEMTAFAEQLGSAKTYTDYTIPFVAVLQSRKITKLFQNFYRDTQIEDLWIPLFCVTSNLSEFKPEVHNRGSLWRVIRASTAIPVAMTPIAMRGDLHVDGSIINNFPVDVMHDLVEGGQVIGVMVSRIHRIEEKIADLEDSVSGWRMLRNKLNPFARPLQIPRLMDTFYRSLLVNSKYHFQSMQHLADLLIIVRNEGIPYYDFAAHREFIKNGYESAKPLLQTWVREQQHRS